MEIIFRECYQEYSTYTFGYALRGIRTQPGPLSAPYEQGFLPYSGKSHNEEEYYMARSIRIILASRVETSEERRISKKHDHLQYEIKTIPYSKFLADSELVLFFLAYFTHHGNDVMPEERLGWIGLFKDTYVRVYRSQGILIGLVIERQAHDMRHYWFSAYDIHERKNSLGMWLMIDSVRLAKKEGVTTYYLGTGYGKKGNYKINNISGIEWWDGSTWSQDIKKLKLLLVSE